MKVGRVKDLLEGAAVAIMCKRTMAKAATAVETSDDVGPRSPCRRRDDGASLRGGRRRV